MNNDKDLVIFEQVSKHYNGFQALDKLTFSIRSGEIFGFIGPNGAGKTTTMRILVGLLSDFTGRVKVQGFEIPRQRTELNRIIGYMPQDVAFQEWRTVDHALDTFGQLSGMDRGQLEAGIPQVLKQVGLEAVRYKKITRLSGGMTQKLGLAQALLHDPRLVVLDEPLSGLDPGSRIEVKALLKELRGRGTTVFFSSHILSDVQDVADRIGILSKGNLLNIGTLKELKARFPGSDGIEIELSKNPGTWREAEGIEGVASIGEIGENRLLLHLATGVDADETTDTVIKKLMETGHRISSFKPQAPSLDELYLKYVKEGERS